MKLLVLAACVLVVSAYETITLFNSAPEPRIVSGTEASDTDFPHHVALLVTQDGEMGEMCGGALLTEEIVLTAAHCFLHFGEQGIASVGSNRYLEGTKVNFSRVIVHEDFYYDNYTIINDVALVKLEKPVEVDGVKVKTIALKSSKLEDDSLVTISGYGKIKDWEQSNVFYYANLTTISNKKCREILWGITIRDEVVCAKGKELQSTCQGDSGGALVINWPENPVHVGVVSFGTETCMLGRPVAFTRTADYIDWILEKAKVL